MNTSTKTVEVFEIHFGNDPQIDAVNGLMCRAFDRQSMEATFASLSLSFMNVQVFDQSCTKVRATTYFN